MVVGAPAVLALLSLRYLVPNGHREPLLGALLFLLFSALARYWHRRLPGAPAAPASGGRDVARAVGAVGLAALAALALRAFVVRAFRVEGASMLPTLEPGDLVAGEVHPRRTASSVERGDVVVFGGFVKRVIGLPGERVEMRGGSPVINGWQVPDCDAGEYLYVQGGVGDLAIHGHLHVEFIGDRAYLTVHSLTRPFPDGYVVKAGEVFVLGDDRGNSVDSRTYNGGHGGGVSMDAVDARIGRFLVGTHRNGEPDFGRLLRPVDGLQARVRLEGLDVTALDEGVARCLANRPVVTRPPITF